MTSYTFFTVGAVTGLNVLGIDLSSLTLFSGALGIGLGLGFQPIVKNFASGLILLVEQPVKVGDRVQVDDLQEISCTSSHGRRGSGRTRTSS